MTDRNAESRRAVKICDECRSEFISASSSMAALCAECAHVLYDYPACRHVFDGRCCKRCGWDGSRSPYLLSVLEAS